MSVETEAQVTNETPAAEVSEPASSSSVQAAYDRIANPGKAQDEPKEVVAPTAEKPPEPAFSMDEVKELKAQVARIPELEKRLRDEGGRYGALKQSLEQIQHRLTEKKAAPNTDANVDDILADIKKEFGEDQLYTGLKSAFSKLATGRNADPEAISKIVAGEISKAKQAELKESLSQLDQAHPTWREDRTTPEFQQWRDSLSERERERFARSQDPIYVSEKLDQFQEWKAKKAAAPEPTHKDEAKPEVKPEQKPAPSKRLASAVLPTNGTKPKATGDDSKSQIRAAYERVAGNRR